MNSYEICFSLTYFTQHNTLWFSGPNIFGTRDWFPGRQRAGTQEAELRWASLTHLLWMGGGQKKAWLSSGGAQVSFASLPAAEGAGENRRQSSDELCSQLERTFVAPPEPYICIGYDLICLSSS